MNLMHKCLRQKWENFLSVLLTILLTASALITIQNAEEWRENQKKAYGYHQISIILEDLSGRSILDRHGMVKSSGVLRTDAQIIENEQVIGYIGQADSALIELESWELFLGAWPGNADEIVCEKCVLDKLHLPYEIGQKVEITWQQGERTETGVFQLSGILQNYTANWSASTCDELPSVFTGAPLSNQPTFVLCLDTLYSSQEEASELEQLVNRFGGEMSWNSNSFPDRFGTISSFFENGYVTLILLILSILGMFSMQLLDRNRLYERVSLLQSLGMSRRDYLALIRRTVWQTFGLSVAGSIAAFLLWVIIHVRFWPEEFWAIGIGVLFSSISCLLVFSLKASIIHRRKQKAEPQHNKQYVSYKDKCISYKNHTWKIQAPEKKFFHGEKAVCLFSLCVFSLSLFAFCDEQMSRYVAAQFAFYDYSWESRQPNIGLTDYQIIDICSNNDIEEVLYTSMAEFTVRRDPISISYANMDKDPYPRISNLATFSSDLDSSADLGASIVLLPEETALWEYYVSSDVDTLPFLEGKSAILYLPPCMENQDGTAQFVHQFAGHSNLNLEDLCHCSLSKGLPFNLKIGDRCLEMTCSSIIEKCAGTTQGKFDFLSGPTVLVSSKLYCDLFSLSSPVYNTVWAAGKIGANLDALEISMSGISRAPLLWFTNQQAENLTKYRSWLYHSVLYAMISMITASIACILLYQNRIQFYRREAKRISLLMLLGADWKTTQRLIVNRAFPILTVSFLFLADIVILFVCKKNIFLLYISAGLAYAIQLFFDYMRYRFPYALWIVPQVLVFGIMLIIITPRKSLSQKCHKEII